MLSQDQYFLCKIAEEAAEISQQAMKAVQFGIDEVKPDQPLNNLERLMGEYYDLIITMELFIAQLKDPKTFYPTREMRVARREKMIKYADLAIKRGQVSEELKV